MNDSPQAQPLAAPEKLFVQLTPMGGTISYIADPRKDRDNRRPVYVYVLQRDLAESEALRHVEEIGQQLNDGVFEAVNAQHAIMWLLSAIEDLQAATPRAQTGLTVEVALKELREMFPRHYCSISHEGRLILLMGWELKEIETVAKIRITSATVEDAMLPVEADADSLEEAMDQVRAWKAKNK